MSQRFLESLLQTRLEGGLQRARGRRETPAAREARRSAELLLERAESAVARADRVELTRLDARLAEEVRTAIPVRSVRRTLEPATHLELSGRRRTGPRAAAACREALEDVATAFPTDLWASFTIPTDRPRELIVAARRAGLPVGAPPPSLRVIGRRLGVSFVRVRVPPHPMFAKAARNTLSGLTGRPVDLLAVGGFAVVPRLLRQTQAGQMTLQKCRQRLGVDDATFPERGMGTTIAVLDTGIDLRHPAFREAVAAGHLLYRRVNQYGSDDDRDALAGHGTHVAGIAFGAPRDATHEGMAPNARQVVVRVFEPGAETASNADLLAGLTLALYAGADVVNLSLGVDCSAESEFGWVSREVVDQGLALVVGAAGNDGDVPSRGVDCPANLPGVMAVAAVDPDDRVAWFSTRGRPASVDEERNKPDLAAYGVRIVAPAARTNRFKRESGTSMATPVVAGVAACLLARLRAEGRPDEVSSLRRALLARCSREGLVGPGGGHFPMTGWNRWVGAGVPRFE